MGALTNTNNHQKKKHPEDFRGNARSFDNGSWNPRRLVYKEIVVHINLINVKMTTSSKYTYIHTYFYFCWGHFSNFSSLNHISSQIRWFTSQMWNCYLFRNVIRFPDFYRIFRIFLIHFLYSIDGLFVKYDMIIFFSETSSGFFLMFRI